MDQQPSVLHVQKVHTCWLRPASCPVPRARGPQQGVAAARTVQRTVPPALTPIFAKSAEHSRTTPSSSTKADASPSALRASMWKMALVNAAVLPAEHVKEMLPTATRVKGALSWTRGCVGKPAQRDMWRWRGCASIAQRCVRIASMRQHVKSACLSPSSTTMHAISPAPATSTQMHASVSPAMKTVWSAVAPQQMTVTSVLRHF